MTHDSNYFRDRAEQARAAAARRDCAEGSEVAGNLALAYATLARRRDAATVDPDQTTAKPLMLRD
jgi:hypothetical protein